MLMLMMCTASAATLVIPADVTEIESEAFLGDTAIDEVVLPEGIESIGEKAFAESSVKKINLPKTLVTIADDAFPDSVEVTAEEGTKAYDWAVEHGYISPFLFTENEDGTCTVSGYTGQASELEIPAEDKAGRKVTVIGKSAFEKNGTVEKVTLPEGIKAIESKAFSDSALKRIHLPASLERIADDAFGANVEILAEEGTMAYDWAVEHGYIVPSLSFTFSPNDDGTCTVTGCAHETAEVKIPFEDPDGRKVTAVGEGAFAGNETIEQVTLPDGLVSIGSKAFADSSVKSINLPDSVTRIADDAFEGCDNLRCWGAPGTYGEQWCREHQIPYDAMQSDASLFMVEETDDQTLVITEYLGNEEKVFIPSFIEEKQVTAIGDSAFMNNVDIVYVSIPDGVTSLEQNAFAGCNYLTDVSFPASLVFVGDSAFRYCSLTDAELPDSVTSIGEYAFADCPVLASFRYPLGWTEAGANIFLNDPVLKEIRIPDGVTAIPAWAFYAAEFLESVAVSESVTGIGEYAFAGCNNLWDIHLPSALEWIGVGAFSYCFELASVELPAGIAAIEDSTFLSCSGLVSVTFPKALKSIEQNAFRDCTSLATLNHLENTALVTVESDAFHDCSSLTSMNLPDSVTRIGGNAFNGCTALSSFHYPASLEKVIWHTPYVYDMGFLFENCENLKTITVPAGITAIPDMMFNGANCLEHILLPESITVIGNGAFSNTPKLQDFVFPAAVETIGDTAFANCPWLTDLDGLSHAPLTYIGSGAFADCENLVSANLPDTVESIGIGAFNNCTALSSFHFPVEWHTMNGNNAVIGNWIVFAGCENLKSIEVTPGVKDLVYDAFAGHESLETVVLPEGLESIGSGAFIGCTSLTSVNIPDSVDTIHDGAFNGCVSLETLYLSPHVTTIYYDWWYEGAFNDCPKLTVWCEYGSVAHAYCAEHEYDYYYLSPDGLSVPSGTIYEGEGDLFGYARTVCTTDPDVVLTEISAVLYQDGNIYRQSTVRPSSHSYNLGDAIASELSISTLPTNHTYRILLTAATQWSQETWADHVFQVIEKPVNFVWRKVEHPSFVRTGEAWKISGEVVCNYDITDLSYTITRQDMSVAQENMVMDSPTRALPFEFDYQEGQIGEGFYSVSLVATAHGKTNEYSFDVTIGTLPVITGELRSQIRDFVNDPDQYSFEMYEGTIQDWKGRCGMKERIFMAWSEFFDRSHEEIIDIITGSETSSFQVELFELEISEMVRELLKNPDLPSVEKPDWYTVFESAVDALESGGSWDQKMMEDTLSAIKEALANSSFDYDGSQVLQFQFELDIANDFVEALQSINSLAKALKWSDVVLKSICELFEDHFLDLEVLRTIANYNYVTNDDYNTALGNIIRNYETQYGAGLMRLFNEVKKEVINQGIEFIEKSVLKFISPQIYVCIKLIEGVNNYLCSCAGITESGQAWYQLATRYAVHVGARAGYYDALHTLREAFADGEETDEQIADLLTLFGVMRTSTARCYDAIADCESDPSFAADYTAIAEQVRQRTMPGLD